MKISKEFWIILGFAFLHAAVALGCRLAGLADDMILTLLTMLLVIILCLRSAVSGAFMAASVVAVNVLGVLLGWVTSRLFGLVFASPLLIYPLSTFVSTLIIGWASLWAARRHARTHAAEAGLTANSLKWLLAAFVVILVTRLAILLLNGGGAERNTTLSILLDYSLTLAAVVALAVYALSLQRRALEASEQANLAQYRYHKLKQQVNPHFLFNSLNILDALVLDGKDNEASEYIHKLAGIYRYMLKNEEESTVTLRDEMTYVEMYRDLLKVRFQEGFDVEVDIPEDDMRKEVIPCSVQLLLENATKHNAVSPDHPLKVRIISDGRHITVTNNLIPRLTPSQSSGLGLNYIREQYNERSSEGIVVTRTRNQYTVKLPLL